jgi:RHS repeat-associated protein
MGWCTFSRKLTAGTSTAQYVYNGDGLRMSKTVGSTTTAFSWDVAEGLALPLREGATKYVYGPGGLPVEQISGSGQVLYFVQDQLGSTRALLDGHNNLMATYAYDGYGNTTSHAGPATTSLQYAGQYTDAESGLQYLRARYYDPATAQFLTRDPLASVTKQPYAYAHDSPINTADPTGQGWCAPPDMPANDIRQLVEYSDIQCNLALWFVEHSEDIAKMLDNILSVCNVIGRVECEVLLRSWDELAHLIAAHAGKETIDEYKRHLAETTFFAIISRSGDFGDQLSQLYDANQLNESYVSSITTSGSFFNTQVCQQTGVRTTTEGTWSYNPVTGQGWGNETVTTSVGP